MADGRPDHRRRNRAGRGRGNAARVRSRSHERARGRDGRARSGRDAGGRARRARELRDPPSSRGAGRRSYGGALVRRLEGDQPRRDAARARVVRFGGAARGRPQQGSRPSCARRAADRLRGVVAFGEAGAEVAAALARLGARGDRRFDARRGARRRRPRASRATRCCSRPRARRSTRTPTTPNAATTSPPRSAVSASMERPNDDRVTPRLRLPRLDRDSRIARVRDDVVRRHRALPRPAVVRRAVRDGRGAEHRRAGDDPLARRRSRRSATTGRRGTSSTVS